MPQQESTSTETLLALTQQDTLTLVCSHEHLSLNGYHLLSLRFLPYSLALSRLFEVLANESEQRIQALMQLAEYLQAMGGLPAAVPAGGPTSYREERHFFVVDDSMAVSVLADAIICERQSALFYLQLCQSNRLPELHALLASFIEQKRTECRVLQDSQGHLLFGSSGPGQRVA
ncbi:hypothetical protein R6258_13205 [Halomonas sp. HP20-15]|uniref:hypothetical protein n=1 Tax=Halomonas sp. HP20-15 TaxID=3085901 RepID=UPI002981B509|nr:hypothetical protein [Halomonas sp. HP20-15]MDW5377884.1 hypothetical protein [Halomonas sp. HP20-15]